MSVENVLFRLSLPQENLGHKYRNNTVKSCLWIRECAANAFGHNAKNAYVFSAKFNHPNLEKKLFVVFAHDGDAFESQQHIEYALRPNTSIGQKGAQGCGGMLSPLLLVAKNSDYQHMIFSKTKKDGSKIVSAKFDDRAVTTEDFSVLIPQLEQFLGSFCKKTTVAYISSYNEINRFGNKGLQDQDVMSLLTDMAPNFSEVGDIYYVDADNTILNGNDSIDGLKTSSGQDKPQSLKVVIAPEEYNQKLLHSDYVFKAPNCKLKTRDGSVINFQARAEFRLYHGVYRSDGSGDRRYPLLDVRNTSTKKSAPGKHKRANRPEFNTFLCHEWHSDRSLDRLRTDPCVVHKGMNQASTFLKLNFSDTMQKYDDVHKHEDLKGLLESNADAKGKLKRKPFCKINYVIEKINSVIDSNGNASNINESDIRADFGGIDEMFMTIDKDACVGTHGVFEAILNGVLDAGCDLSELRKNVKELWPSDATAWAQLSLDKIVKSTSKELRFVDIETGSPIKSINPGEFKPGYLFSSNNEKLEDIKYEAVIPCNSLVYQGNGEWVLRVGKLQTKAGKLLTPDEYQKYEGQETYPNRAIKVCSLGQVFTLNTQVNLPKLREKTKGYALEKKGFDADGASSEKLSSDYRASLSPPERYISYYKGELKINQDNPENAILFKNLPDQRTFQNKFFASIAKACAKNEEKVLSVLSRIEFGSIENNDEAQKLRELWNEEPKQYLLNCLIAPLYEDRFIIGKIKEIREIIEKNSVE